MLEVINDRLLKDGVFVCSQNEIMERFFRYAFRNVPMDARVLCTGLGLGFAQRLLSPRSILTVECDPEIIEGFSVGEVIHADVWTWQQDRPFDFAFHDIWSDINSVPEGDEERLMKRFDIPVQICLPSLYSVGGW